MLQQLDILAETAQYLVVNKPAGLLSEKSSFENLTLEGLVEEYLQSPKHSKAPFVGVVHRLDRVTSGAMVFAKNKSSLKALNQQVSERKIKKTYLAIVEQEPPQKTATLQHHLVKKQKEKVSEIYTQAQKDSIECSLSYRYVQAGKLGHLLEIDLHTGRFHQIRAQLAFIGCPIFGDEKYGATQKYLPLSIGLHAWKLEFCDIATKEQLIFVAKPPSNNYWLQFDDLII